MAYDSGFEKKTNKPQNNQTNKQSQVPISQFLSLACWTCPAPSPPRRRFCPDSLPKTCPLKEPHRDAKGQIRMKVEKERKRYPGGSEGAMAGRGGPVNHEVMGPAGSGGPVRVTSSNRTADHEPGQSPRQRAI